MYTVTAITKKNLKWRLKVLKSERAVYIFPNRTVLILNFWNIDKINLHKLFSFFVQAAVKVYRKRFRTAVGNIRMEHCTGTCITFKIIFIFSKWLLPWFLKKKFVANWKTSNCFFRKVSKSKKQTMVPRRFAKPWIFTWIFTRLFNWNIWNFMSAGKGWKTCTTFKKFTQKKQENKSYKMKNFFQSRTPLTASLKHPLRPKVFEVSNTYSSSSRWVSRENVRQGMQETFSERRYVAKAWNNFMRKSVSSGRTRPKWILLSCCWIITAPLYRQNKGDRKNLCFTDIFSPHKVKFLWSFNFHRNAKLPA